MEILPVMYADILNDPACKGLLAEYSTECSIPEIGEANPQAAIYEAMESSGVMQCFGAYQHGALVGFAAIIVYVLPHYGQKIAAVESLFVTESERPATGRALLDAIEAHGRSSQCQVILYSAPADSRLERMLSAAKSYRRSNSVFVKALQ